MKKAIFTGVFLILAGCATGYQTAGTAGGFSERALAPDTYYVKFNGNGFTKNQRANDFLMLRCADLTIQNGYEYFSILGATDNSSTEYSRMPTTSHTNANVTGTVSGNSVNMYGTANTTTYGGQVVPIHKPGAGATIKFSHERSSETFDAGQLRAQIRAQYKLDK